MTENTPSNKTGNYVAVLECAIKAAEDISTEYGFDEDYELFQSLILAHLVIMKNCAEAGDAEAVQACVEKEAQAATAKFEEWLELIRAVRLSPCERSRPKSSQLLKLNKTISSLCAA